MNTFCLDRDLLVFEPAIFLNPQPGKTPLAEGSDGSFSTGSFTQAGVDFSAAGIQSGMVLLTSSGMLEEGQPVEVLSVSAGGLEVSLLRADAEQAALCPADATGLAWRVLSYQPQIVQASDALAEVFRRPAEAESISLSAVLNPTPLCNTAAAGTLRMIYLSRAEQYTSQDSNWLKAEYYRQVESQHRQALQLDIDTDGDGLAGETRTLSHIQLRRV